MKNFLDELHSKPPIYFHHLPSRLSLFRKKGGDEKFLMENN
jgi:hypothetical protein